MWKSYLTCSKLPVCAFSNGNKLSSEVFKGIRIKNFAEECVPNGRLPIRQYSTTLVRSHPLQPKSSNLFRTTLNGKRSDLNIHVQQRCFRTTPNRKALPPVIVMILGRVANVVAVIFGRTVRRWWKKLPPEEKVVYASKIRRNRYIIGGMLGATAFGSFVYYENHVQETPFTNRKRFLAFTPEQIAEMSKLELETLLQLNQKNIIPANMQNPVYRSTVSVAQRLLNANRDLPQIENLEWTVTVVNDDHQTNAFVLPCGSIFVFTGMLKFCDSEDQLGFILAHEMAHAIMDHGAEKASFMHFVGMMFVIPLAALWALLPTDLIAAIGHLIKETLQEILMELPHSRFIEEEADTVGLILAAKACFDIREAPVVWAKMKLIDTENLGIEWLSTHPSHDKRQAQLEGLLPDALEVRAKASCPRLPPMDPRLKIDAYRKVVQVQQQKFKENLLVPVKVEPRGL